MTNHFIEVRVTEMRQRHQLTAKRYYSILTKKLDAIPIDVTVAE